MSEMYKRQLDVFNPDSIEQPTIHIFGVGTIGSYTALGLSKLGLKNLVFYDFDNVEIHNISNQFYKTGDLGQQKTESLKSNIVNFSNTSNIEVVEGMIDDTTVLSKIRNGDIVILAFDNLESRKLVYDKVKDMRISLIDGRMGLEILRLYTLNLSFQNCPKVDYEKTFNQQSADLPCTARTINYNGMVIGGLISSLVKKLIKSETTPFEIDFDINSYSALVC